MTTTWALTYTLISVVTAAIIFLIYRHVTYDMGSKREIDAFRVFLISFFAFVICNGVCIWANRFTWRTVGTIFTALNLIGISATAYLWFYYIEERLNPVRMENRKYRVLMLLPMLVVIIVIASSLFTHLIYYYNENGEYCRGPLYAGILIASILYLVTATVHAYRGIEFAKTKSQKQQYNYLGLFIIFPFLAGVIDFLYAHLPTMELVVLFGIILIYLNLQDAQVYRDALTGLNNRRLTDEYLTERIAFVSEQSPLYYFLADIDQFKSINDQYGHLEGDRALRMVSDVLKRYTDIEHYYISRWGGDEFVMIVDRGKAFDPDVFQKRLDEDIRKESKQQNLPYDVSLSIGYIKCVDPKMKVDDVIRLADQRMYAVKYNTNSASQTGAALSGAL